MPFFSGFTFFHSNIICFTFNFFYTLATPHTHPVVCTYSFLSWFHFADSLSLTFSFFLRAFAFRFTFDPIACIRISICQFDDSVHILYAFSSRLWNTEYVLYAFKFLWNEYISVSRVYTYHVISPPPSNYRHHSRILLQIPLSLSLLHPHYRCIAFIPLSLSVSLSPFLSGCTMSSDFLWLFCPLHTDENTFHVIFYYIIDKNVILLQALTF